MAKTNVSRKYPTVKTHEGGKAYQANALGELRRTLSTCLLFENTFYEGGDSIANRLGELAAKVSKSELIDEIIRAKEEMFLRHAPLWMAVHLTKNHQGFDVGDTIYRIVNRADELAEFVSMYWKVNGKGKPISKQAKVGLSRAFNKFDAYQFSKYDRDGEVKLRDVMFLVHPKPLDGDREMLYTLIANDQLPPADTWEVALSAAKSQEERTSAWTRLMVENRLGALALIRNLRNMEKDGVDRNTVSAALDNAKLRGILPYQLVAAWKNAPSYAHQIDAMAQRALQSASKLDGMTVLIVDVSGSMDAALSSKSDMNRIDAAGALAAHLVGVCEDVRIFTFSSAVKEVQRIPGFGIINAINGSQPHGGTWLAKAVSDLHDVTSKADRVIVITDEQAHDGGVMATGATRSYMVNVASYQYGVEADKSWTRISGFSPAIVDWILQEEVNPLFGE